MLTSSLSFVFVAGALAAALPDQDLFAPNFPVVAYQMAAVSPQLLFYEEEISGLT